MNNIILARFSSLQAAVTHANCLGVDASASMTLDEGRGVSYINLGNGEVIVPHPHMGREWILIGVKNLDVLYPFQTQQS